MTTTPTAPAKPAKLPREEDPRNPVTRLRALLDEGTMELITPDDDSGMLAAVGSVDGTRTVAFCSDATVMGGAMGDVGCRVVVDAYHRAMTEGVPDHRPLALRRCPAGRGRALAPRGRPHLPRHDPGVGPDPPDLGRARPGRRRRGVRPGADRRRDPRPRGPDLRHRARRRPVGDRRGRRHAAARRPRAARPPFRRGPHPHRVRAGGARPRAYGRVAARLAGQPRRARRRGPRPRRAAAGVEEARLRRPPARRVGARRGHRRRSSMPAGPPTS